MRLREHLSNVSYKRHVAKRHGWQNRMEHRGPLGRQFVYMELQRTNCPTSPLFSKTIASLELESLWVRSVTQVNDLC